MSTAEDPQLILEQERRDMQDQLPKINTQLARAKGALARLEKEIVDLEGVQRRIGENLKSMLRAGQDEAALPLARKLKKNQEAIEFQRKRIQYAKDGCATLERFKDDFKKEMDQQHSETDLAIRQAEASRWKGDVASAFEAFETADLTSTHEEMMAKLTGRIDEAEGRLAMGLELSSEKVRSEKAEKKFEDLESKKILDEFRSELGSSGDKPILLEPMGDGAGDGSKKE